METMKRYRNSQNGYPIMQRYRNRGKSKQKALGLFLILSNSIDIKLAKAGQIIHVRIGERMQKIQSTNMLF